MEWLRRALSVIQTYLGKLQPVHKMLIGSLAVIALMTLFLVSQYAGKPQLEPLEGWDTPESQGQAAAALSRAGIRTVSREGKLWVPAAARYRAIGTLASSQTLPQDTTKLFFSTVPEHQNWLNTDAQNRQLYEIARNNELARIIASFPEIEQATVVADVPEHTAIGRAQRRATASVTVFPRDGSLSQNEVDAIAGTVAGSIAGLDVRNVRVINGQTMRQYLPRGDDEFGAGGSYLEQQAAYEERVQQKALQILGHIPGVIVAATAVIDATRRSEHEVKVAPKGEGSESMVSREILNEETQTDRESSAEPGPRSNTQMSINPGGGGGSTSTTSETETEYANHFGETTTSSVDPGGQPMAISVAVNVPREWVIGVLREQGGGAGAGGGGGEKAPTAEEIETIWETKLKPDIEEMLRPVVLTSAADGTGAAVAAAPTAGGPGAGGAGEIVVNLMPVALATVGLGPVQGGSGIGGGSGGGLLGGMGTMASSGLIEKAVLGSLAAFAVLAMLLMVRRAGRSAPLPSAEELVGVPPALQHDQDLVGEADEGETAMTGIEIDDDALRARKMLDEVNDMVKSKPDIAASLMTRWLDLDR